jgi:ketosteroid isomerase-like protein
MSEENVEVVKAVYEAANRRDADAVLALYDPGVELDPRGGPMGRLIGPGIYRGHEGVRRFFRAYHEAWGQIDYEVEELIDGGERVFGVHNIRARGRGSGVEVERRVYGVWTIRDRKIVRVLFYTRREEALEAAGLLE